MASIINVGINGMGVLGRRLLRMLFSETSGFSTQFEVKGINDPMPIAALAYLVKNDTVYGRWEDVSVTYTDNSGNGDILRLSGSGNSRDILVSHETNISNIHWDSMYVEQVVDCTGAYNDETSMLNHLTSGNAKSVICCNESFQGISAFVYGVNISGGLYKSDSGALIFGCPTKSIAQAIAVEALDHHFSIECATIQDVISYTNLNNLEDSYKISNRTEYQMGRAGAWNIIPSGITRGTKMIGKILPHLNGRAFGTECRCGTIAGSISYINYMSPNAYSVNDYSTFLANHHYDTYTLDTAFSYGMPCCGISHSTAFEVSSDMIGKPFVLFNVNNYCQVDNGKYYLVKSGVTYDNISVIAGNAILLMQEVNIEFM